MSGPQNGSRPTTVAEATIAELGRAGVATVYEAYGRRGLLDQPWEVVAPGRRAAGTACIALCGAGDNRAVHEAVAAARPGQVLVITMTDPEPVAVLGDLLATQAAARGVVGIVVDAAVRDVADLAGFSMAIATRWRRARGATKNIRGEIDVPVTLGGTTIAPGDVVVLDDDGVTAVQAEDAEETLIAVRSRITKEADLRARWANGELSYDAYGLRAEDNEGSLTR